MVIPIILRTLAGNIPFIVKEKLPLAAGLNFLATLDAGEHEMVSNYELRWWTGRKARDLDTVEILTTSTVDKCLTHYRQQKSNSRKFPAGAGAGPASNESQSAEILSPSANLSACDDSDTGSPLKSVAGTGCRNCTKYKQLLSDVLRDILKFHSFASVMSISAENMLNVGIRRASTFHNLHEAANLKETPIVPPPAQAPTSHRISEVLRNASSELNRLKNLPASSYKWTWGETLTTQDVLNLRRTGTRPGRAPHSGYDLSLPVGKEGGEWSSTRLSSIGQPDDLPADLASFVIPSTDLHFPEYFSQPADQRRYYAPFLYRNTSDNSPAKPSSSLARPLLDWRNDAGGVSDLFKSIFKLPETSVLLTGTGSVLNTGTGAGEVADLWSSGSEAGDSDKMSTGTCAGHVADFDTGAGGLADLWTSGSESGNSNKNLTGAGTGDVIDLRTPSSVEDTDPVALAELWIEGEEHSVDELPGTSYANEAGDNPEPMALADLWFEGEDGQGNSGDELTGTTYANEASDDPVPVALADLWFEGDGQEHSGDELVNTSYTPLPGSPSTDVLDIADQWSVSEEDPVDETDPADTQIDRPYRPEDFSFLRDHMFEWDD